MGSLALADISDDVVVLIEIFTQIHLATIDVITYQYVTLRINDFMNDNCNDSRLLVLSEYQTKIIVNKATAVRP